MTSNFIVSLIALACIATAFIGYFTDTTMFYYAIGTFGILVLTIVLKGFSLVLSKNPEPLIENTTLVERREGMFCRMCGGACDLENCGMEQP